jgi:hypothetical protein
VRPSAFAAFRLANKLGGSFLRAVRNVAKQEDRSQEIERDWAKDCDLSERSR